MRTTAELPTRPSCWTSDPEVCASISPCARLFTLEQANRALPLVRAITRDVMNLARSVRQLRFHLAFLARGGHELEELFPAEMRALRDRQHADQRRLIECMDELLRLGVQPEAPSIGLVDFPAIVAGRSIAFCWRLDEPRIGWWHHRNGGYVDRRPLAELVRLRSAPRAEPARVSV